MKGNKMLKGLEALKSVGRTFVSINNGIALDECDKYKIIEKELKALEIIKNKQINYRTLLCIFNTSDNYNDYNKLYPRNKLTEEEYNLLREVLK